MISIANQNTGNASKASSSKAIELVDNGQSKTNLTQSLPKSVCFECGKSNMISPLTQCSYYLHITNDKQFNVTKSPQYYCRIGECAKNHYRLNHNETDI